MQNGRLILIDGHVHIYPDYDWAKTIEALLKLPAGQAETSQPLHLGLLAESRACCFFKTVLAHPALFQQGSLQLTAGPDTASLCILKDGILKGFLIAGRQIVTREKLEILGLGADITVSDGLTAEATLDVIIAQGAVPVLSWSPGKWFFGRGKRVRTLIDTQAPGRFLVGDTGLRPTFWPLPGLMKYAAGKRFKIIGGSDPLPLPDEECWAGTYGVSLTVNFDPEKPAASLRKLLTDPTCVFAPIGHRAPFKPFLSRWLSAIRLKKRN